MNRDSGRFDGEEMMDTVAEKIKEKK